MKNSSKPSIGATKYQIPFVSGEQPVSLVCVAPGILIISQQETVEIVEAWRDVIEKYSGALIAANLTTPDAPLWLVSSIQNKPTGGARVEAKSHSSGNALDLAPIYSLECLTNPDALSPSLATDIINLMKLAQLKVPGTFSVVEGDHLHIVRESDPFLGKVVAYPTLIPWYNSGQALATDPQVRGFMEKFFIFSPDLVTYSPATAEEVSAIMSTLNNYASAPVEK